MENTDTLEMELILAAYRARLLREHMVGPAVSFALHLALILLLALTLQPKVQPTKPEGPEIRFRLVNNIVPIDPPSLRDDDESGLIGALPQEPVAPILPPVEAPDPPEPKDSGHLEDPLAPPAEDLGFEGIDLAPAVQLRAVAAAYTHRSKRTRQATLQREHASPEGQQAAKQALAWLASVQQGDGSWPGDPAFTALALLCFLAQGETPLSEHYGETVRLGMQWLAARMPLDGKPLGRAYTHGICTYALAESYGMTRIPLLKAPLDASVRVILAGQQETGGFDYRYNKGNRWDLSVAGWQLQALKAASYAGVDQPGLQQALDRGVGFLRSSQRDGKFGYASPGEGSPNMTGIGIACLQLLQSQALPEVHQGLDRIADTRLPQLQRAAADRRAFAQIAPHALYGWYYDTQAAHYRRGALWNRWRRAMEQALVYNQHPDGYWDVEIHKQAGLPGKVFSTALCCLQLQVYVRVLSTFERKPTNQAKRLSLLD